MSPAPIPPFPIRRMRRLRRTPALRRLVQETHLAPSQLVWPRFVVHGEGVRREVPAMPGVDQTSVDQLVQDAERAHRLGLGGLILFGIPKTKDATGSEAHDEQGIVQQAIRAVKRAVPDLLVMGDVCLCEYTDHGHCGVISDGEVENDSTVYLLGKIAVTQARAGVDIVAPSDMMAVDKSHTVAVRGVFLIEVAPLQKRDSHGLDITGCDHGDICDWRRIRIFCAALNLERLSGSSITKGKLIRRSYGGYPWKIIKPFDGGAQNREAQSIVQIRRSGYS